MRSSSSLVRNRYLAKHPSLQPALKYLQISLHKHTKALNHRTESANPYRCHLWHSLRNLIYSNDTFDGPKARIYPRYDRRVTSRSPLFSRYMDFVCRFRISNGALHSPYSQSACQPNILRQLCYLDDRGE